MTASSPIKPIFVFLAFATVMSLGCGSSRAGPTTASPPEFDPLENFLAGRSVVYAHIVPLADVGSAVDPSTPFAQVAPRIAVESERHQHLLTAARQLYDQGRWLAGAVCGIYRREIKIFAVGLLPDYAVHLKQGALSALYVHLFEWAETHQMKAVDLLRSRPNSADGVYRYKKSWGAKAQRDSWPHASLQIYLPTPGEIPAPLKTQLVWHRHRFVELADITDNPSSLSAPFP